MSINLSTEERSEAIRLLQNLVQIDTTNPPGNEGKASEFLKDLFDREGIQCEVLGPQSRESFVAWLGGKTRKPRLLLLSHTDVVPVTDPARWTHPPFSGKTDGDWLYGRGACDDKFDVAVEAMAMILLKRRRADLSGTVIYAATADEEAGAHAGCGWLTENAPDKVRAEYILNEGGGSPLSLGGKVYYSIGFGEKGICRFRLTARGRAGHGSIPTLADNANLKMADAFLRLAKHKTDITILPEVKNALLQYGRALMGDQGAKMVEQMATPEKIDDLLDRVQGVEKEIAETTRALTRMTISPNVIRGGNKVNVIPDIAEGEVDTRVLLGQDEKCATNVVEKAIQGTGVEIAEVRFTPPSSSPTDTQFIQQLIAVLRKNAGDVGTIMMLNTGMTDSRFFRALGGQAYGFVPAAPTQNLRDILPGVHGHDEKIDLASIEFATKYLFDVSITVLR